jgi:hypothetical protein
MLLRSMRRALPLAAVLIGLLACTASASAATAVTSVTAGFNPATKKLEAAYKVALRERRFNAQDCYPAPAPLAKGIASATGGKVSTAQSPKQANKSGIVYILKAGATCDHLSMALRDGKLLYILDSVKGSIRALGKAESKGTPGLNKPVRRFSLTSKTFMVSQPDEVSRGEALCPRGTQPLGGGMTVTPQTDADGEGIYPHSYERLGAQRGWHVSVVLLDPSRANTSFRGYSVQVVCGKGLEPATPIPHKTVYVKRGETKTVLAKCPKGQQLITGGFQRTDFRSDGGDYPTESRAIGTNAWQVTGHSYGDGGGELTSIAYCVKSKRPLLTEVSASSSVPFGASANATTPACPAGQRLTTGGFSANGSINSLFAWGSINPGETFTVQSYGFFGAAPTVTAYGYCLRVAG